MNKLKFVPKTEFDRALKIHCDSIARCSLFATLCRINTLYMISSAGSGHLGSSFSSLDIVAWLYLNELRRSPDTTPTDIFFSSKGHDVPGLYAILIGLGLLPFYKLHTLRRLGGLPGHPDVSTPNIAANSGSLGMGISKAKGMILADRLDGRDRRIFVMTGDGELQEGQIWESLQGASNSKMRELTVIVDHNKIQSDHWVTDTSALGSLEARFGSFGWHVQRCDGHQSIALGPSLNACRHDPRPSVIIADTVKGRGVKFMEPTNLGHFDFYQYHSGAPSAEEYDRAIAELETTANAELEALGAPALQLDTRSISSQKQVLPQSERLIPAYGKAIVDLGKRNDRLVVLDADLVLDCGLVRFRETFPDRYFECGISEMDMVSQAGGLALAGKLPIVHSFACFLTPRANEQIYTNATENSKIIYVGSLAGLVPSGPGHSHQSVRDIALMSCIPKMMVVEPSCVAEMIKVLDWMVDKAEGPSYLRLTSVPAILPTKLKDASLTPGHGTVLLPGNDALVITYGPIMLGEALRAAIRLHEKTKLSLQIVNLPWLNQIDLEWLRSQVAPFDYIFTIDNHYLSGGQGEKIASALSELNLKNPPLLKRFGLNEIPACGTNIEALRYHGLDSFQLCEKICMEITGKILS